MIAVGISNFDDPAIRSFDCNMALILAPHPIRYAFRNRDSGL